MGEEKKQHNFLKPISLFFERLKTKKYMQYVLAAVLSLVVVVIFLSSCSGKNKNKNSTTSTKTEQISSQTKTYSEILENKLVSVLSSVKGCGTVKAMVVTRSTEIGVIAMQDEEKTGSGGTSNSKTPIYEKNGSSETPYIQSYTYPEISGVLIVASGAGDTNVKLKIINAVVSVLGVDTSKIEVLEGK